MLFLHIAQDNISLHKAFLVGILPIAKSGFLSGLNNLCVYSMEASVYADKFGFTEEEVALLLYQHGVDIPFKDVQSWYNGYNSGKTGRSHILYNPWSINRLCS